MNSDLSVRASLFTAFPPASISHEMIHAADARWADYEARDQLALIEGKSWQELTADVLEQHAGLLIYAGNDLYRAILPAYLRLLAESDYATILPFHVVSQLTFNPSSDFDRNIFETRVRPMSAEQRSVVRSALSAIAQQTLLREVASAAMHSW